LHAFVVSIGDRQQRLNIELTIVTIPPGRRDIAGDPRRTLRVETHREAQRSAHATWPKAILGLTDVGVARALLGADAAVKLSAFEWLEYEELAFPRDAAWVTHRRESADFGKVERDAREIEALA